MHRPRPLRWLQGVAAIGSIALLLSACGSTETVRTANQPQPLPAATIESVSADAGDTDNPPDIEAILAANAEALRDLNSLDIDRRPKTPRNEPDEAEQPEARDTIVPAITKAPVVVQEPAAEPERELTRKQRISMTAEELAMLIRAEADQSDAPISMMAALSALELIERGVAPDPDSMPWLTDRERELLSAFRDLFIEAGGRLQSDLVERLLRLP